VALRAVGERNDYGACSNRHTPFNPFDQSVHSAVTFFHVLKASLT
jgi:hypothetical protein